MEATSVFTAAGNKILNNKIHDVTDASVMDSNGYGGDGLYLDDDTGLVDVENNLVYRVSGLRRLHSARSGGAQRGQYHQEQYSGLWPSVDGGRLGLSLCERRPVHASRRCLPVSNNLFYFDRNNTSAPTFWVQGGCVYAGGLPFTQFAAVEQQPLLAHRWRLCQRCQGLSRPAESRPTGPQAPCSGNTNDWTFYTFARWQAEGWRGCAERGAESRVRQPGLSGGRLLAAQRLARRGIRGIRPEPGRPHESGDQAARGSGHVPSQRPSIRRRTTE